MPVFLNRKRRSLAFVSYKAMYSRFMYADTWEEIGVWVTPRIAAIHTIKHRCKSAFQIIRHPEPRFVSFFMDKFRIQPTLCESKDFQWQACHHSFFPLIGMSQKNSNQEIANAFLKLSFDRVIEALPEYYAIDPHTWPQTWTSQCRFSSPEKNHEGRKGRWFRLPGIQSLKMEESESLPQIPDVDFSKKTNQSSYFKRDFQVTADHRETLRRIYADDYRIGDYADPQ